MASFPYKSYKPSNVTIPLQNVKLCEKLKKNSVSLFLGTGIRCTFTPEVPIAFPRHLTASRSWYAQNSVTGTNLQNILPTKKSTVFRFTFRLQKIYFRSHQYSYYWIYTETRKAFLSSPSIAAFLRYILTSTSRASSFASSICAPIRIRIFPSAQTQGSWGERTKGSGSPTWQMAVQPITSYSVTPPLLSTAPI